MLLLTCCSSASETPKLESNVITRAIVAESPKSTVGISGATRPGGTGVGAPAFYAGLYVGFTGACFAGRCSGYALPLLSPFFFETG